MYNDTVSDFITRLRNATMAGKPSTTIRKSKLVEKIAEILKQEDYLSHIGVEDGVMTVTLNSAKPISHLKRLSKPSIRRYVSSQEIPRPKTGYGLIVISTPKGVLTGYQARKQKVGGELICEVW